MRDWKGPADMKLAESVCTHSILVLAWNIGTTRSQNFHHLCLKSRGVVMVVEDEFYSQPCLTIWYTNGEILERSRCCEWPESAWRHSIWVPNVYMGRAKSLPTHDSKIDCSNQFIDQIKISSVSNHSLYYWWEIERVQLIWNWLNQSAHTQSWCETWGPCT